MPGCPGELVSRAELVFSCRSGNNNDNNDGKSPHNSLKVYCMLGPLHISPFILKALRGGCYHLHFTHEETEVQPARMIWSRGRAGECAKGLDENPNSWPIRDHPVVSLLHTVLPSSHPV